MKRYQLVVQGVKDYHATLITGCWFLPPHVQGLTLGKHLVLTKPKHPPVQILAHELTHMMQFTIIKWLMAKYIWEYIKHGAGMSNKYELVAYEDTQYNIDHYNFMVI